MPPGQGRRSTDDTTCRLPVFGRRFTSVGGRQGNGLDLGDDERPAPFCSRRLLDDGRMLLRRRCREGIARRRKNDFTDVVNKLSFWTAPVDCGRSFPLTHRVGTCHASFFSAGSGVSGAGILPINAIALAPRMFTHLKLSPSIYFRRTFSCYS